MVIFADVDRLLNKNYLKYILKKELMWPWPATHFTLRNKCLICGVVYPSSFRKPKHVIIDMNNKLNIIWLIENSVFFCHICNYLLYDHYLTDECEICAE
jgi:hypothetical protein